MKKLTTLDVIVRIAAAAIVAGIVATYIMFNAGQFGQH
jgi:hypothetical protein